MGEGSKVLWGELRLWDQPSGDGRLLIGWSIDRHWTAKAARVVVEVHKREPWAAISSFTLDPDSPIRCGWLNHLRISVRSPYRNKKDLDRS